MKAEFSKNLVLLRKEQGLSQKQVAADLLISQALLSHYEKGIRECGLNFVVRAADYFAVSSDFLLGRSTQRNFVKPSRATGENGKNKTERTVLQSLHIVFAILEKINSQSLMREVAHYLCAAVYTIFRMLAGHKSAASLFSLDSHLHAALTSTKMTMAKAKSHVIIDTEGLERHMPLLSPEALVREYPTCAAGLQELIKITEQGEA